MATRLAIVASHGAGVAIDVDAIGGLPSLDECLLGRVLGEVRPAERPQRDHVHEASVLAIERPHGGRLAASEGLEHVGVHRFHTVRQAPGPVRARSSLPVAGCE